MNILASLQRLTAIDYCLMAVLLVVFGIQIYYYSYHFASIIKYRKKRDNGIVPFVENLPPVSVIICAKNESENLRQFLPAILEQDYPCFEVIVVNDGSTDETSDLLQELSLTYPNLYRTFVPENANIRSTKKLGLTIGIKAAKFDVLLFTDADCKPASNKWIENMARNFTQSTEFVLGYGAYMQENGFMSRMISFDTLFIGMQSLGYALNGHPYMGVGRNMAYRKETFVRMKGFSKSLGIQSGDDDLFVNNGANEYNTRVEISAESVTWSVPKSTYRSWFRQKERHLSTSSFYKADGLLRIGVEVASRGLFYALICAIAILSPWTFGVVAGIVFLMRYSVQLIVVNKVAKQFNERKFYFSLLMFDVVLPLISLYIKIFSKKSIFKWK
ncbi:glycosyltransferase [Paludibacter jiangxiensis]|uniref:Glycosyltransferase n=1 Tax=Paludibacter jiangxiensis TaxID=681398 RepID=A0A170ZD85_9BACT|nr:glycosyltransferase [Paludibacter jiangxiensis]GAT62548.1 glycosyltransferase [Paludibacter jiangxiensis]